MNGDRASSALAVGGRGRFLLAVCLLLVVLGGARLVFIPRLGNGYDLEAYRRWAAAIQDYGLADVFRTSNTDYVGYNYLLWATARSYDERLAYLSIRDKPLRVWLKAPGIVGDAASALLVVGLTLDLARRRPPAAFGGRLAALARRLRLTDQQTAALGAGLLWGLNPALIYAGVYWGQNDSLTIAFMLAALWSGLRGRPGWAAMLLALGAVLKPQPLLIAPVLAWVVWRRSGIGGLARAAGAGALTLLAGHAYFIATGNGGAIVNVYRQWVLAPALLSYNAYNLWWPAQRVWGVASADPIGTVAGVGVTWGNLASVLVLAVLGVTGWALRRRDDNIGVLLAAAYLVFGFFLVGAGAHERYVLPALAVLTPVVVLTGRSWLPLLALTLTLLVNSALGLPLDRLYPPGKPVWLSLAAAGVNVGLFALLTWQLLGQPGRSAAPAGNRGRQGVSASDQPTSAP